MMKKIVSIFMAIFSVSLCFFCASCLDFNEWRETNINGYYRDLIGWPGCTKIWSVELDDEEINDQTKYFIARSIEDSETRDEINFYVSYGYYTIEKIYEEENYIEYHLSLEYVVKDQNAPKWDEMSVIVQKDKVYCIYNSKKLYKRD